MKFKFVALFLYIVLFSQVNEFEIKVKTLKRHYHPFMIYFDYKQLNTNTNKPLIKKIKVRLNQIKKIFSQILSIREINIIKSPLEPNKFCEQKIQKFDRKILKEIKEI